MGCESRSLRAAQYRRLLSAEELTVLREWDDEGQNHYYDAIKMSVAPTTSRSVGGPP